MSEQKESSVLFSLKELMNLEEDRIKSEEADRAAQSAAAERARMDADRAARDAEESRIRAEQERRRLDEQRVREEAARLDAIRAAEVEKARLDAEQRARLEAMAAQQSHERSMAAIKQDAGKKRLRNTLIVGGLAVLLFGGGGGFFAYQSHVNTQRELQVAAEQRRVADEDKNKLQAAMREQQAKTDGLLAMLSAAKDDATRLALQKQLEEEREKTESIKKGGAGAVRGGGPAKGGSGAAKPACNCTPGDPLCSCL